MNHAPLLLLVVSVTLLIAAAALFLMVRNQLRALPPSSTRPWRPAGDASVTAQNVAATAAGIMACLRHAPWSPVQAAEHVTPLALALEYAALQFTWGEGDGAEDDWETVCVYLARELEEANRKELEQLRGYAGSEALLTRVATMVPSALLAGNIERPEWETTTAFITYLKAKGFAC